MTRQKYEGGAKMGGLIQSQLLETLGKIDRPGTFCTNGFLPAILPGLEVAGVGSVGLPLENRQATALKKQARQAPYGKGTQTLVDTNVRNVWEIDAEQVVLANAQWADVLKQALASVRSALGLETQKLEAHLYKLLLYEIGSFFLAHRDGEKLDRMVATLVVTLPSAHAGGELVARHEGREEVVDFEPQSQFQTQFAAFYADCEHEIRPVTRGYRLSLVYNLTLTKARSKTTITAPTSREHITKTAGLLRQWSSPDRKASDSEPAKLAVLLDYEYIKAGLQFDTLKGTDRGRADVLFAAAQESGCDAYLALVTYWETGSGYPTDGYGYDGYDRYEDDGSDYIMEEVFDSYLIAEHFSDAEGNPLAFGEIPLDEEELVSHRPITEGEPDEEDFEGYTGNAGMTLERWYHRAAVLLWPTNERFDVLCQAAVGGLEQMVREWKGAKKSEQENLKSACLEFAKRIIANWPERQYASGYSADYGWFDDEEDDFDEDDFDEVDGLEEESGPSPLSDATKPRPGSLLSLLEELGEVALITAWIDHVLVKDATVVPGKKLGDLCKEYGWKTFENELRKVFESTSNETLERNARLLADWTLAKDKNADRKRLCFEMALEILVAMDSWNPKPKHYDWRAKTVNPTELLPPLVQACFLLEEPELQNRLVISILNRPEVFDLTTVQVPVLLDLKTWLNRNVKDASPALDRWLSAIRSELEHRAAHPPQEPTDWRRQSDTGCNCADCKELRSFLEDPNTKTLRLPLAQQRRRHLHNVIDRKKLDTTHATERRGRPYTLVCTKTQASYERAAKAHQVDLDHLAKVQKILEWHQSLPASEKPPKSRKKTTKKRKSHE